jgi:hypothetical protein
MVVNPDKAVTSIDSLLRKMSQEKLPNIIIFDIEPRNHLEKDCGGDVSKLKIGIAGIKFFKKDKFSFFDETNIDELEDVLLYTNGIVGFNLVGHNGLDYKMLENYGICVELLYPKTFDLMTVMIRAFGSYKGLSLDNIAENTFGVKKKNTKKANYKLIQSKQIEKVKDNLKHELTIIEMLYLTVINGGIVRFKTPLGLIDEHELPPFAGIFPEIKEEICDPYDLPGVGIRLQIKDKFEDVVRCEKCKKHWRIKSVCYYSLLFFDVLLP